MSKWLAETIQNLLPYSEDFEQWDLNGVVVDSGDYSSPDGGSNAVQIISVGSDNPYIEEIIGLDASTLSRTFTASIYGMTDASLPNSAELIIFDAASSQSQAQSINLGSSFERHDVTVTFSVDVSTIGVQFKGMETPSSGDYFYLFGAMLQESVETNPPYQLTSGASVSSDSVMVEVNPEYDFSEPDKKIESNHTSRNGKRFKYLWGETKNTKFSVSYVDSSFKTIVNSWWGANASLRYFDDVLSVTNSGWLMGDEKPVSQRIKPYDDLFAGVINLGSF